MKWHYISERSENNGVQVKILNTIDVTKLMQAQILTTTPQMCCLHMFCPAEYNCSSL